MGDFSNPKPTVEACQWRLVKCEPLMTACFKSVDEVTIQSFDKQVPSLLALLVQKYKSSDVLLRSCVAAVCRRRPLLRRTQFPCFTSTKVQLLRVLLSSMWEGSSTSASYLLYWYRSTNTDR